MEIIWFVYTIGSMYELYKEDPDTEYHATKWLINICFAAFIIFFICELG